VTATRQTVELRNYTLLPRNRSFSVVFVIPDTADAESHAQRSVRLERKLYLSTPILVQVRVGDTVCGDTTLHEGTAVLTAQHQANPQGAVAEAE